ncbi:MAG TPA: hypothetical protein VEU76_02295 [Candidatus Udaeobacter sp.]|nr:hypothetical protein [Candidatus Udaeobacter sp.]
MRSLPRLLVLVSLAAGLIGCDRVVSYQGALPPSCTESIPSQSAPPLQTGADALTGLEQRPMRPPAPAATGNCASSSGSLAGAVSPNYGAGVGPAYMSGQDTWYAGGQALLLMVDARYSGPLLVRPYHISGDGTTVTFVDLSGVALANATQKEEQHGVSLVPAAHTSTGGLYLAAVTPTSFWRAWIGQLSTDGPGWFGFQVDGDQFTEFIVFQVNAGSAPPG